MRKLRQREGYLPNVKLQLMPELKTQVAWHRAHALTHHPRSPWGPVPSAGQTTVRQTPQLLSAVHPIIRCLYMLECSLHPQNSPIIFHPLVLALLFRVIQNIISMVTFWMFEDITYVLEYCSRNLLSDPSRPSHARRLDVLTAWSGPAARCSALPLRGRADSSGPPGTDTQQT